MSKNNDSSTILPFPKLRRLMVDGGRLGRLKHIIHGLVEMDVTRARHAVREHKVHTSETLSFTAFVIACLGHALDMHKHIQAYRNWRGQLVIFDEVDVNTLFEVEDGDRKIIRPHIIRAVNKKSLRDIHEEIRAFQAGHAISHEAKFIGWFVLLPRFIRQLVLGFLIRNPHSMKEMSGTVLVSAVGMFCNGGGWGIPVTNHTLQVTLGGIAEKSGVVDSRIEIREYLSVTLSFDHDIVDGAPAARFTQQLKELIESGYGLCE